MGQGPHVLGNVLLGTQDRADPVAGVVYPVLHGYGPFQDRPKALAHPPGAGGLPVPDRGEDLKQIGARDLGDRHLADAGEGETPQARHPLAVVTPAAPAVLLLFQHTRGGFGEGGDALGASLLGKGVPTLTGELAVDERLLPSLGQGDQGDAAETELTATATDDQALNPAACSAGLDEEVQSVSIGVSSGGSGAQEGGREGVVGVAAGRLGFRSGRCEVAYSIHPPII